MTNTPCTETKCVRFPRTDAEAVILRTGRPMLSGLWEATSMGWMLANNTCFEHRPIRCNTVLLTHWDEDQPKDTLG